MDVKRNGNLSKDDLRTWTKAILSKKYPGVPFCEKSFEQGYRLMDKNKDGLINIEDIKDIVKDKVKAEKLYSGN